MLVLIRITHGGGWSWAHSLQGQGRIRGEGISYLVKNSHGLNIEVIVLTSAFEDGWAYPWWLWLVLGNRQKITEFQTRNNIYDSRCCCPDGSDLCDQGPPQSNWSHH